MQRVRHVPVETKCNHIGWQIQPWKWDTTDTLYGLTLRCFYYLFHESFVQTCRLCCSGPGDFSDPDSPCSQMFLGILLLVLFLLLLLSWCVKEVSQKEDSHFSYVQTWQIKPILILEAAVPPHHVRDLWLTLSHVIRGSAWGWGGGPLTAVGFHRIKSSLEELNQSLGSSCCAAA